MNAEAAPPSTADKDPEAIAAILSFWLDEVGEKGWWRADADVDAACSARFGALVEAASRGALDGWADAPDGALALLILLDQFPRNMFRGRAEAFAADPRARTIADAAIAAGHDVAIPPPQRLFFYTPFEHSEAPADQDRAVALIAERLPAAAEASRHAEAHRAVIQRFGRFPHRNAALGRTPTPEETAYLDGGGYAPGARPTAKVR